MNVYLNKYFKTKYIWQWAAQVARRVKSPPTMKETRFSPWVGKIPLQYSCLENPMDRGAWRATVHEVGKELDTTLNNNISGISKYEYRIYILFDIWVS